VYTCTGNPAENATQVVVMLYVRQYMDGRSVLELVGELRSPHHVFDGFTDFFSDHTNTNTFTTYIRQLPENVHTVQVSWAHAFKTWCLYNTEMVIKLLSHGEKLSVLKLESLNFQWLQNWLNINYKIATDDTKLQILTTVGSLFSKLHNPWSRGHA